MSAVVRRFAWGFGVAGLVIPLLIEGAWMLGLLERFIPGILLEWVILVWPLVGLTAVEDVGVPVYVLILAFTVAVNALLYAAVGALVGVLVGFARPR